MRVPLSTIALAVATLACPQDISVGLDGAPGADAAHDRDGAVSADDAGNFGDAGRQSDGGQSGACFVSPFEACTDPTETSPNDKWSDASQLNENMSVGCVDTGDDVVPLDRSISGVLCNTEPADYYRLTVVSCDTKVLTAELRLHVQTECPSDRVQLEFLRGGKIIACGDDPNVQCLTDAGDMVMRMRVPADRMVGSWQFGVLSDFEDVRFEYTLSLTLQ